MKIKHIIPILILFMGMAAFCDTEANVVVVTSVPYSAKVEKASSIENITVNPENGVHSGLSSVFNLETNGTDNNFDFVITSSIDIQDDTVSAYGNDGRILLTNTSNLPTLTDVDNAKKGIKENNNVIAYNTNVSTTEGFSSEFKSNYSNYGNCWVIKVNGTKTGTVTHQVLGSPIADTYSYKDHAGSYKAVLNFTIIGK